jgi:ubiquinol-cytochrome c reductase cytochrome b subunit
MSARGPSVSQQATGGSWFRTTGGIVLMLLSVQFVTGVLLAFYYVPSADHAYTTVSFIEKVLSSGSWIRSLHYYGSQWLPFFIFLYLIQLTACEAFKHSRGHWVVAILLLTLVMAAGGTGYSLPWDARAFFSTRVAEGLIGGLPVVGRISRLWLLAGNDISTLTLSRFFALHILVTPFFILLVLGWRFSKVTKVTWWANVNRNVLAAGVVFIALAIWTLKNQAPLGPSIPEVSADYLPRPGAQFLWLFQTLKYVPGAIGSIVGVVLPGLAVLILLSLPWLDRELLKKLSNQPQRLIATVVLSGLAMWVVTMTATSYLSDQRDPRARQQLAKQAAQEQVIRNTPFKPVSLQLAKETDAVSDKTSTPESYQRFCANCHGAHGEGGSQGALKFPTLVGVAAKPRRTVEDIVALLNDPIAYGIEPPMRSFATKLTEPEKREIAEWVRNLK